MAELSQHITTEPIPGFSVYGVQQNTYSLSQTGQKKDYGTILAMASFFHANTIEAETAAYAKMIRLRMQKLEDLGEALSIIAEAVGSLPPSGESSDKSKEDTRLHKAADILKKYGLPSISVNDNKITREDAVMAQNDLQTAIDTEDNALQMDMVSLQSLVSKRDTSFSTASKILQKFSNTGKTLTGNIGG